MGKKPSYEELEQRVEKLEREVAERRETEVNCTTSAERGRFLADVLERSTQPFVVGSVDGRIILWNAAFCELLGYRDNEIKTTPWLDFTPVEWHADDERANSEVRNTGRPQYLVKEYMRKDGSRVPVELYIHPGYDTRGRFQYYYAFITDITERKRAETALRDSEEMFRAMAATAQDAIVILDNDGNISYWNPMAEDIFGYTTQEAVGKDLHILVAPERYHEGFRKGHCKFKNTGEGTAVGKRLELEAVRKDGTEFPIELSLSAVQMKGTWHAVGIARNIDERKRMEEELRRLTFTDGLTGVANRRHFDQSLDGEWKRALRDQKSLALILGDIDFFKNFNDYYGHQKGDDCLKRVAKMLAGIARRAGDLVARYGGEEFAIILSNTTAEQAQELAEKARQDMLSLKIPHKPSSVSDYVTVSMGIASKVPSRDVSISGLIEEADKALYRAKQAGRNQWILLPAREDTEPIPSELELVLRE